MVKHFKSKEAYRKFIAYTHMRTPTGKRAIHGRKSISQATPTARKECVVTIAGKRHYPKLTKSRRR